MQPPELSGEGSNFTRPCETARGKLAYAVKRDFDDNPDERLPWFS